jgi:hypothetical protein
MLSIRAEKILDANVDVIPVMNYDDLKKGLSESRKKMI